MSKSCLIIAGEKSGEDHCLSFYSQIENIDKDVIFFGVGGDELEKKGMELIYHLKDFSSWGISEVITKIPFYKKALSRIEDEVSKRDCKYAILIDFQGFNHRLAKRLKKRGVKVFYYVAPQAWAWKAWRARELGNCLHTLFTIIPFEKKWFQERGVKRVFSVPHPLMINYKKQLESLKRTRGFDDMKENLKVLLLPGSRNYEVKTLLPEFLNSIDMLKKEGRKIELSIVCSESVNEELYIPYLKNINKIYKSDELEFALSSHDLALAASGTVTLACALFEIPTIVAYQTSLLNEFIFKTFVSYEGYISLANIVHQEEVFPELMGENATAFNINSSMKLIIDDESCYNLMCNKIAKTAQMLSGETFDIATYITDQMNE